MVHLLQLITTLLFLSHAEVEAVQRELVPASLKVWKLMGAEAKFFANVAKITTNSENLGCNQTNESVSAGTTACPQQKETTADLPTTTNHPTTIDISASTDADDLDFPENESVITQPSGGETVPTNTTISNITAIPTNETMDTTEATLTNVTFDTTEATPTSEMTDDAEVTPSSELTDNTEAAPTSETTDNTEGALTNATMDTTELISTDETTDTTEATPISETTDDAEATPTSETTDSTEATPADETTDNTDAALTNATMDTTEATPTSAAAPSIPTTDQPTQHINEQCNKAAHFDVEKGGCVCNNPEMDAKRRNPIKYRRYSEGDVCYSCQASNSTTAIVFILDESGTVKRSGWRAQKTFMRQLLNLMGDIKVGVVVIAGNSYVAVPLDDYRKNKWAIDKFIRTKRWGNKWTSVGVALYRARKMLEGSTADSKNIIIFSDGDTDACRYNDISESCPQWKRDNIRAHPQAAEARAIHKLGINVTFVAVNFKRSRSRIRMIASSPKKIVKINSFTDFNDRALYGVINSVCKAEKLVEM